MWGGANKQCSERALLTNFCPQFNLCTGDVVLLGPAVVGVSRATFSRRILKPQCSRNEAYTVPRIKLGTFYMPDMYSSLCIRLSPGGRGGKERWDYLFHIVYIFMLTTSQIFAFIFFWNMFLQNILLNCIRILDIIIAC